MNYGNEYHTGYEYYQQDNHNRAASEGFQEETSQDHGPITINQAANGEATDQNYRYQEGTDGLEMSQSNLIQEEAELQTSE